MVSVAPVLAQFDDGGRRLMLNDAVLPTPSKDPVMDSRIFDPEFYRKFNSELGLSTDADAIKQWRESLPSGGVLFFQQPTVTTVLETCL